MIATLRQRDFALLWLGGLISLAGDWVLIIGLPIYVYLLTRSVLATSAMMLAGSAPNVVLASVAGVFVDRWDRKRTMVIANLLLALALLPLLIASTPNRVGIVYLVAFVESCVSRFFAPAQNALLPVLVGEEHLVSANSLNSLSSSLARLTGPALGGIIAAIFGLTGMVLVDAASFLIAGALISLIVVPRPETSPMDSRSHALEVGTIARIWHEWLDGVRVIRADRTLALLVGVFTIMSLGEGVFGVLYPVFVNQVLRGEALQIGELMSAQAAGGLIGGVLVGWAGKRLLSRWAIGLCSAVFGLIDLVIFNAPRFVSAFEIEVGLFVAVGIPGIAAATAMQTLLQARPPDSFRGRVFGAMGATMGISGLIGTITAGTVTDHLGVVTVLTIQGLAYVVVGLLLISLLPREGERTARALPTHNAT